MKRAVLFIGLCHLFFQVNAQEEPSPIQFPDKLPASYIFDVHKEYDVTQKEFMHLVPENRMEEFAEQVTVFKVRSIQSGEVYLGWDEMETYLNKVLDKIMPDSCKNNPRIHVFPARSSDFNAFCLHDGSIFFNVSFFAELTNEAAVAFILGHELSHYLKRDAVLTYNKRKEIAIEKEKKKNRYHSYDLELADYNKEQESTADSLGAILAANAGYDINFVIGSFYKLKGFTEGSYSKARSARISMALKNEDAVSGDSLDRMEDLVLSSHPDELSRIRFFTNNILKHNRPGSREFITAEKSVFKKLQKQSRVESLDILLSEFEFHECTSRAFSYYLLEGDRLYIYYLLESMRRGFEANKKLADKAFLTEDLRDGIFPKGHGILHNLHAQVRDTNDYKQIKKSPLTDSKNVAFETWDEAFNFFADMAIDMNYTEDYLPIALRNNDTIPLRNFYLDKYLEKPNMRYTEYARALREDRLLESLSGNRRKLVIFSDMALTSGEGVKFRTEYFRSIDARPGYSASIKRMMAWKYKGKEYVDENELKQTNFRQFVELSHLQQSILSAQNLLTKTFNDPNRFKENYVARDNSFKALFSLNPDLWYIFRNNNIRSVQYLDVLAYQTDHFLYTLLTGQSDNFYGVYYCYADVKNETKAIYYEQMEYSYHTMTEYNLPETVDKTLRLFNEK